MFGAIAIAGCVLAYTYVGYPILVAALARLASDDAARDASAYEPTVTVCMPVYNADAYLRAKLESLFAQDYAPRKLDVLVFSDGSTDESDAIVQELAAAGRPIRLLRSDARVGKPTALERMRAEASGEVLLMTDARQPLSPNAVRELVAMLADPSVGCAAGNLVLEGAAGAGAYWRYEKWIRNAEARIGMMVGVSGALYAIRRSDVPEIPADTILDDMWIPLHVRLSGRQLRFCDGAKAYDQAFDDDREFGRKVRTLAGNFQLMARMPALLVPIANPCWPAFISHKVLRLVCPWAMALLLVATAVGSLGDATLLGVMLARALLAGQLAFYALAALGAGAGRMGVLARTFVVLNAAAVVALWKFARGGQRITW